MNDAIAEIIYYMVITLPYRALAYIPFYKKLRLSLFSSIFLFFLVFILQCILMYLLIINKMGYRVLDFIFALLCMLLYFTLIKEDFFKLLFFYILIADIIIIFRGITFFIQNTFFSLDTNILFTNAVIHSTVIILLMPLIIITFKKTTTVIFEVDAPKLWRKIWLLPLVTTAIILIYTYDLSFNTTSKWQFIASRSLFIISTVMIYGVLLNSLSNIRQQGVLTERAKTADSLTSMYKTQYNTLSNHITEVRKARHDLRQHINLIQTYLDNNDQKALSDYIALYRKSIPKKIKTGYCLNKAVDVILGWYGEQAETNNINFITDVKLTNDLKIPETVLCVIFGNLLENAIDECKSINDTNKFIKVCSTTIGNGSISITVDNSCTHQPIFKDNIIMSTKHSGIGYGTYSVKSIAEQFKGIADFKYNNNVFYTSVLLNDS